jgi:hypothetical protein
MVSNFLARAVVDEVLSPAYLSEQNNKRPGDVVVEKAISLLSREHCTARLERVWGPGDGRPVAELKVEMDQLLQEYLLSRELGTLTHQTSCKFLCALLTPGSSCRRMCPLCQGTGRCSLHARTREAWSEDCDGAGRKGFFYATREVSH